MEDWKKNEFINDDEFDLEKLEVPNEIKSPQEVFGNLISFYDGKIKEIENKIKELEKNISVKADEKFLNNEHIGKYFGGLKNGSKYMEKFMKQRGDKINKIKNDYNEKIENLSKDKDKIIDEYKNYLNKLKEEKNKFEGATQNFQKLFDNIDNIKIAYDKKRKELQELKNKDYPKYEKEKTEIQKRIEKNMEKIEKMYPKTEEINHEEIKKLTKEADKLYFEGLKQCKVTVEKETRTTIIKDYSLLGACLGVIGGVLIGGPVGGAISAAASVGIGLGAGVACGSLGFGIGSAFKSVTEDTQKEIKEYSIEEYEKMQNNNK
jgi:chromosome segregation ATPase